MVGLEPRGNTLNTSTKSVSMKLVHRKGNNFEKYVIHAQENSISSPSPKTEHRPLFTEDGYGFQIVTPGRLRISTIQFLSCSLRSLITETGLRANIMAKLRSQNGLDQKGFSYDVKKAMSGSLAPGTPYPICCT